MEQRLLCLKLSKPLLSLLMSLLAAAVLANWSGPSYSGGQYMTWTSGPWPYSTGSNGYGGGGSSSSGQITATFTWQGGGSPPDVVHVLEYSKATGLSNMNQPAPTADNGIENQPQFTTTWLSPFFYQLSVKSEGRRITEKWIGGATSFQVQVSPSASGQLGCSVAYTVAITDRKLELSRADGGQFTKTGPAYYVGNTTYSGMASILDVFSDPNYSEKNIQGIVTKALGSWDLSGLGLGVVFAWAAYLQDQPYEGTEYFTDYSSPFEITDNSFLPYGTIEAWPKETVVKATDLFDGATSKAVWKWIIHKQVEDWSEASTSYAYDVVSVIVGPQPLYNSGDSMSAGGQHAHSVGVTTGWTYTGGVSIPFPIPMLTPKSFGNASLGATYANTETRTVQTATTWNITLTLGPRPPGYYKLAWVIRRTEHNGTATYWNRLGQTASGLPHVWIPASEYTQLFVDLVWAGPL